MQELPRKIVMAPPQFGARIVKDSAMIEINPYLFYWVCRQLHDARMGFSLSPPALPYSMGLGKDALKAFLSVVGHAHDDEFLPKSKAKAREIITFLDYWSNTTIQQGGVCAR